MLRYDKITWSLKLNLIPPYMIWHDRAARSIALEL